MVVGLPRHLKGQVISPFIITSVGAHCVIFFGESVSFSCLPSGFRISPQPNPNEGINQMKQGNNQPTNQKQLTKNQTKTHLQCLKIVQHPGNSQFFSGGEFGFGAVWEPCRKRFSPFVFLRGITLPLLLARWSWSSAPWVESILFGGFEQIFRNFHRYFCS